MGYSTILGEVRLDRSIKIEIQACGECGVVFGLGTEYVAARRQDHRGFYCPNGHSRVYLQDNEEERLKQELDRTQTALASARSRMAKLERSRAAVQGQVTRLKKRAQNGVCPCCHRHFAALERHMASKHPDFAGEGGRSG